VALSDETLMAYADGELTNVERVRVEAELSRNASYRARLEAFKVTRRAVANLYLEPLAEPAPEHLVRLVLGSSMAAALPGAANSRQPLIDRIQAWLLQSVVPGWGVAIACVGAVIVGFGAARWLDDSSGHLPGPSRPLLAFDDGRLIAQGALHRLLESEPSGRQLGANATNEPAERLRVRLTFSSHEREYCRQYEIALRDGQAFAGIGCRKSDATWHVRMHAPIGIRAGSDVAMVPAGSESNAAIAAVIDNMIDGDALGPSDELQLLQGSWRR